MTDWEELLEKMKKGGPIVDDVPKKKIEAQAKQEYMVAYG
jgi:hypothetical protein